MNENFWSKNLLQYKNNKLLILFAGFVQYLQFRYQHGVLYRLKALGERHNMDITIEGFHSWMWRGLSFLFPFLFIGYFFQLYNAYTLYCLISHTDATWHVHVLSIMFLVLFLGNTITTILVIPQKRKDRFTSRLSNVFAFRYDRNKSSLPKEPIQSLIELNNSIRTADITEFTNKKSDWILYSICHNAS